MQTSPSTQKVTLTKEKETLLATLYARALESQSPDPILQDPWAQEAVDRIDYDFTRLKADQLSIVIRARQFDQWALAYLAAHPNAIVLQLGCGLDSRIYRLNPAPSVRWIDVDYPEVIELRQRLYPPHENYEMIGASLADLNWVEALPPDRPALILLEGVSMYLSTEVMHNLLERLTTHFATGQLALDAIGPAVTRMAKGNRTLQATGATFGGFSIAEPDDLKKAAPKLQLVEAARTPQMVGYHKLPLPTRALVRLFDSIPGLRNLSRILLYKF